jgi:hypothetical protein
MALGRSHLKDHGVLQLHDFPASHHYGGPHDNAGKVPRIRMSQDEAFEAGKVMQLQYQWPTIMCAIVPKPMCVLSCLVLSFCIRAHLQLPLLLRVLCKVPVGA